MIIPPPPTSLDPGSDVDKEFGCRPKLIASLPRDAGMDGCDDDCTDGDGGCGGGDEGAEDCEGEDPGSSSAFGEGPEK